ncbi:plasmid stabilization protein [Candidatus Microgenomates bacterium]|nr:plasmid stabilization protein [Candidatus Microgenomates bacterium]
MNLHFSSSYLRAYRKIIKKNPHFHKKVKEKLKILKKNPRHPSLRLHKLEGSSYEDWSISIDKDIRILLSYVKNGIILVDIGKHDDIY